MRLLFTMFAEDSGLIPEKSFINLLKNQRAAPQHLEHQLAALWAAMDAGDFSPALGVPLRKFNGYLFKDCTAIPLDAEELRSEEHTSELQSLMRISYAVFCLKKKKRNTN